MKKFFLFVFVVPFFAFSYTDTDVSSAQFLSQEGIINPQSDVKRYRLDDTITRAEVVGIALKMKGVTLPEKYACRNYFSDVKYNTTNNWICRAMELAADLEIITRNNSKARPQDTITRAEALGMIINIVVNPEEGIPSASPGPKNATIASDFPLSPSGDWILDVLYFASATEIIENPNFRDGFPVDIENEVPFYFYPNRLATRADVFGFARNALEKFNDISCNPSKAVSLSLEYFQDSSCIYLKTSWAYQDSEMVYIENADADSFVIIDELYARDKDTVFKVNQGGYISVEIAEDFSTQVNAESQLVITRSGQKYLVDFSTKELKKI